LKKGCNEIIVSNSKTAEFEDEDASQKYDTIYHQHNATDEKCVQKDVNGAVRCIKWSCQVSNTLRNVYKKNPENNNPGNRRKKLVDHCSVIMIPISFIPYNSKFGN